MQRLRSRRMLLMGSTSVRLLKKKTLNSWAAVCDTFLSTKDIFERHKMVFTIGSSLASVATAWAGIICLNLAAFIVLSDFILAFILLLTAIKGTHYAIIISQMLIEGWNLLNMHVVWQMKNNHNVVNSELEKLLNPGGSHITACIATAGTTFLIGYGLGWRGGRWYAARKLRKEQMKQQAAQIKAKKFPFLGRMRPNTYQFQFLGKQFPKIKRPEPPLTPTSTHFKI